MFLSNEPKLIVSLHVCWRGWGGCLGAVLSWWGRSNLEDTILALPLWESYIYYFGFFLVIRNAATASTALRLVFLRGNLNYLYQSPTDAGTPVQFGVTKLNDMNIKQ